MTGLSECKVNLLQKLLLYRDQMVRLWKQINYRPAVVAVEPPALRLPPSTPTLIISFFPLCLEKREPCVKKNKIKPRQNSWRAKKVVCRLIVHPGTNCRPHCILNKPQCFEEMKENNWSHQFSSTDDWSGFTLTDANSVPWKNFCKDPYFNSKHGHGQSTG